MNMPLGGDHAAGNFHLALGADQLARARARNVAGFTDRRVHADGTRVRQGNFHLRRAAHRAQNAHVGQRLLGADHVYALFAGVLAGLGEHFLDMQFITRAKERFQILLGHVHMTRGRFHNELFHRYSFFLHFPAAPQPRQTAAHGSMLAGATPAVPSARTNRPAVFLMIIPHLPGSGQFIIPRRKTFCFWGCIAEASCAKDGAPTDGGIFFKSMQPFALLALLISGINVEAK